jgi:hypothetical protein
MALRISRRTFVGWLVRSASAAAATAGLLTAGSAHGAAPTPVRGRGETVGASLAAPVDGPVAVRMADLVLEGRALWAGLADGVRLPSQGGDAWELMAERPGGTYTSPALQAEFPCTHVGVHWRTDGGDQTGLRVELRASRDGQTWMPWRRVSREAHGPDRAGSDGETFGVLVGARLGIWLQARLTFGQAGPEVAAVQGLTLTCLDSRRAPGAPTQGERPLPQPLRGANIGFADILPIAMERGAETALTPALSQREREMASRGREITPPLHRNGEGAGGRGLFLKAGPTGFLDRVISREAWGADESLRFKNGVDQWLTAFVTPSLLVVHHTASEGDIGDAEADVRAIYAYHAVTQGWGDIGYNLLIDSSGRVYEGRRGREPDANGLREIVSEGVVAGHALDYNYGSVGIALLGNFQERQPGQVMIDTLVDALAFMAGRYGIDPASTQNYARVRGDQTALWRDGMNNVSGHRDCLPTECPGDNVYKQLPEIRRRVEEQLGARGPAVTITRGPSDRNAWPGDLAFQWEGDQSTTELSARLAGFRRNLGADTIAPLSGYSDDQRPAWGPWSRERTLSVPLPPDARGVYTLFVRARDAAGQEGRVIARWPVVVDRHAVVDDTDALRTRHEGAWERSREILGYYGTGYQQAAPGQDAASYRWQLAVPESGTYAVQAIWTEAPDRTEAAAYTMSQGGTDLGGGTVNQQQPGGTWTTVLEVLLGAGVPCTVELAGAADGMVVADAIRLVLLA